MFFSLLKLTHLVILATQWTRFSNALQVITANTLPSDSLSASCIAALTSNVNCARQVTAFRPGAYKPIEVLERACTSDCSKSLADYQKATQSACGDSDSFPIGENRQAPASFIPQILFYNFNRTCIKDEGRWCNVVAKGFADSNLTSTVAKLVSTDTNSVGLESNAYLSCVP